LPHRTGAALLPVITQRVSGNIFQVQIRRPLATDAHESVNAIQAATAGYLAELEGAVRESPEQWRGWKYLDFAPRQQAT
jgi:lauroyl/myristoyl acyltransferase